MTMLDHPLVRGALQSILGTDYWVHMHRHPHFRDNIDDGEPGKVHHLHKDSMTNSRFAVDAKRRQHRTRMCMLVYFPQDTPVELGPTGKAMSSAVQQSRLSACSSSLEPD